MNKIGTIDFYKIIFFHFFILSEATDIYANNIQLLQNLKHIYLSTIILEPSLVVSSLLLSDISKVLFTESVKRFSPKLHDVAKKIARSQTGRFVFARTRHVCFKHRLILVPGHRINFAHRLSAITSARSRVYRVRTFESTVYRRLSRR